MPELITLPAGLTLYHGTGAEFDPEDLALPAWFAPQESVARYFARRGWSGPGRVLRVTLDTDTDVVLIRSARDMAAFAERYGVHLDSAEDILDSFPRDIHGWKIEGNYPDGDDILLMDSVPVTVRGVLD
ncbi:hypothetical protein [Deinococcus soli (ex Cha et al. 2016)]|uniref:Uncharacterized protein n=2 Tax=Deinococcus soli (ex Cha et al. 2016) TaxID=1309411 RepID=A0ACC6KKY2_9DEIO|nr:hypothetical protein [Deinococcus soli (ex Cha et al. 2016)]MDR6218664.1 hypothetical protein [Deinococcus soli (ex Cha et al. 2016)]MDR6328461.1 hypothetical protein [Deinococcus soli (ex Cha et al. 2016)]MDR6753072.1 hypothetical protein [Deinococcus soli (ex Cha et al. 2016)]